MSLKETLLFRPAGTTHTHAYGDAPAHCVAVSLDETRYPRLAAKAFGDVVAVRIGFGGRELARELRREDCTQPLVLERATAELLPDADHFMVTRRGLLPDLDPRVFDVMARFQRSAPLRRARESRAHGARCDRSASPAPRTGTLASRHALRVVTVHRELRLGIWPLWAPTARETPSVNHKGRE